MCWKKRIEVQRNIYFSAPTPVKYPSNAVKNTKYNLFTFFPLFLFYQFKQPLNLFFLVIALTQFYPPLQVGFLFTYVAPLVIVLTISLAKEAWDDIVRWQRDREVNSQTYIRITQNGSQRVKAEDIKVGHILEIKAHERVPADMIILHTADESGSVFIKTDQLDGETDWKLRRAVSATQQVKPEIELLNISGVITAQPPSISIHQFEGRVEATIEGQEIEEGLSVENTLWATTTLASGSCIGMVVYTGKETRSVMNSREPSNKIGITDMELNKLAMYLLILMLVISFSILCLAGFNDNSFVLFFRYVLLLSTIIPISLRVNLDFAKLFYCYKISRSEKVGRAQPRNSTIPEELGRIHFLLTDKTGTLTQNDMVLKKLFLENLYFDKNETESLEELEQLLLEDYQKHEAPIAEAALGRGRKKRDHRSVRDMVTAIGLCHNVTPIIEDGYKIYQASSPDEISLVEFAKSVNVELYERTQETITLRTPNGDEYYEVLHMFPFSSATKRMGVIIYHKASEKIIFYLKGAEEALCSCISNEVSKNKMLEDCQTLATEGLRTLVVTQRVLSYEEFQEFDKAFKKANASMNSRHEKLAKVIQSLEHDMEYLGVTGVEDKLQNEVENVISDLNSHKNANIKVWMLTGDKVETAKCIAIATNLKKREQQWFEIIGTQDFSDISVKLEELKNTAETRPIVAIIDGGAIGVILESCAEKFIKVAGMVDAAIICRASPTQKTQIVECLKKYTNYRVCSIGDGGNDVGMIQAAHLGIGIEGKEGKQASLAADFSINEFKYLAPLLLWHGRLSYIRTAKLSNFIFHRGLIIAVIQALFSIIFYYVAIPIYNGYLMLGYTTVFTSMPVFSLVLDKDADYRTIAEHRDLYMSLQSGHKLNGTSFLIWIWKSLYQGSVIILLSILLFPDDNFINIVAITFSSLIFTELLNIATEIDTWNRWIVFSESLTLVVYLMSILLLKNYFNLDFIISGDFFLKVMLITACSWLPLHIGTWLKHKLNPSEVQKYKEGNQ
mgnify:FL=1